MGINIMIVSTLGRLCYNNVDIAWVVWDVYGSDIEFYVYVCVRG